MCLCHTIAGWLRDDSHDEVSSNFCVRCGVDMGADNPRQLCRKTYCDNWIEISDADDEKEDEEDKDKEEEEEEEEEGEKKEEGGDIDFVTASVDNAVLVEHPLEPIHQSFVGCLTGTESDTTMTSLAGSSLVGWPEDLNHDAFTELIETI